MLEHGTSRNLDVLEGIPTFAKLSVPSMNHINSSLILPAYFTVTNLGNVYDIQIYLSMDIKEPSGKFNHK